MAKLTIEIPEMDEYLKQFWAQEVERVVNLIAKKVAEDTPKYFSYGIPFELTLTMHHTDKFKEAVISALATGGIRAYYSSGGYAASPTIVAKAEIT